MEIQTVWGVNWKVAGFTEMMIALIVILLLVIIALIVKMYLDHNTNISHEFQYVLFEAKSKGLTNFQYKIVRGMAEMLRLKRPSDIMDRPELYEESIGQFIKFISEKKKDSAESLTKVFRDIVITYEKLFKDTRHKQPLDSFENLDMGHLLYFYTDEDHIFLGKLLERVRDSIVLELFRKPSDISYVENGTKLTGFFWRPGDAEYTFNSRWEHQDKTSVTLGLPDKLERGREVRLPFVNVIFQCEVCPYVASTTSNTDEENEENEKSSESSLDEAFQATVFKMAESEIVVRTNATLDYAKEYSIQFSVGDFTIKTVSALIADKTISDKGIFYYTFKFKEISKAARKVIRAYIYEHL